MATGETKRKFIFFENQTANASSAPFIITEKGSKYIIVSGTPDTAIVDIEIAAEDGAFVPIDGGKFSDTVGARLMAMIPKSVLLRATISSVGAGTSLTVEITK